MLYSSGVVIDDKLWCIELERNNLVSIDLNSGETSFEVCLSSIDEKYQYECIERMNDDTLIIAPFLAEDFIIYNIITKEKRKIAIPWNSLVKSDYICDERKIGKLIVYRSIVYAIGFSYPGIIMINANTLEWNTKSIENKRESKRIDVTKNCYFSFKSGLIKDEKLIIPLALSPVILEIDLYNFKVNKYRINGIDGIASLCFIDGNIYCIDFSNKLVVIDKHGKQEIITFDLETTEYKFFCNIFSNNRDLYLVPHYAQSIYKYNIDTGKIGRLLHYSDEHKVKFINAFCVDEILYAFEYGEMILVMLNLKEENKMNRLRIICSNEQILDFINRNIILDEKYVLMDQFLNLV